MRKTYVLAVLVVMIIGMTACSFGGKESAETKSSDTESVSTEAANVEASAPKATESSEKETSEEVEIPQGDPIVALVESYEDQVIVLRDLDDGDIVYYFSTQDAEMIEGASPIAAGDIVELTYRGVQGDKEHPGMAVKVVARSEMYK